jgi:hypothetical protein
MGNKSNKKITEKVIIKSTEFKSPVFKDIKDTWTLLEPVGSVGSVKNSKKNKRSKKNPKKNKQRKNRHRKRQNIS